MLIEGGTCPVQPQGRTHIYPFYIKFQFSLLLSLMQGNTSTGQCAFKSDQPLPPPLSEFAWHQVTYQANYILSCIPRLFNYHPCSKPLSGEMWRHQITHIYMAPINLSGKGCHAYQNGSKSPIRQLTYWFHIFRSSSLEREMKVRYLVVPLAPSQPYVSVHTFWL